MFHERDGQICQSCSSAYEHTHEDAVGGKGWQAVDGNVGSRLMAAAPGRAWSVLLLSLRFRQLPCMCLLV